MTNELITYCRYYKGESITPYKDGATAWLWEVEKEWAHAGDNNQVEDLRQYLQEYFEAQLAEFQIDDATPIRLKALIFKRYQMLHALTHAEAKEPFKQLYLRHYN